MDGIKMIGCKENNLKNINITIPYSSITSFVGVSGSGKSSIVFDTLYAEGKRRYIESFSISDSFFLSKQQKPDAEHFIGIPPAIALAQRKTARNPRSTVGTITQAAYYIQSLFSSCGDRGKKSVDRLTPSMFNINSPSGICMSCNGTGQILEFDETLIWPDQTLSVSEGGLKLGGAKPGTTKYKFINSFLLQFGCDVNTPICQYSNELKVALLFGQKKNKKIKIEYPGIIPTYEKTYTTTKSLDLHDEIEKYMKKCPCLNCDATGLNPDSLTVTVNGLRITDVFAMSIVELKSFISNLNYIDHRRDLLEQILKSVISIFDLCIHLGVGYLSLDRKTTTLSGGELQRLHIVSQISSQMSGVVYVLDEPSSGMHPSDIKKLIDCIKQLNAIGNKNTIVMVEHTRALINASDYIYEIGPSSGDEGGYIVAQGTPIEIQNTPNSLSGKYLSGKSTPGEINFNLEEKLDDFIEISGAFSHNLKEIDVTLPLHRLCCITGVSGSGKTSLIFDSFYQSIQYGRSIGLLSISGMDRINKVIVCDQGHIGTGSRSCPATYSEVYENIRKLFAKQLSARENKYTEEYFSFNLEKGQCPKCKGEGKLHIDMGFLPEMLVTCDECNGTRFKQNVLNVRYKNHNIADVLRLSVNEAIKLFDGESSILAKLTPISEVGLGYIKLGQPTNTLSGGEAQRLKLAYEMSGIKKTNDLILFDEPSRGLHFEDVRVLLMVMRKLVDKGHSVILIEHNLDIIAASDYVIDIGPYAGKDGGKVCGTGTPKYISQLSTPTGFMLAEYYAQLPDTSK